MKNIGIIGSGVVARSLAVGFIQEGYSVKLGSRNPAQLQEWLDSEGEGATSGSMEEAAAHGDILVLAVGGRVAADALRLAKLENIQGKTIIDPTNPISEDPPVNGVLKFTTDINYSLMEELQAAFPEANFVKAFNSVGAHLMYKPQLEATPSMFICGNNEAAKAEVGTIVEAFGWDLEDVGAAEGARGLEPLCILWCIPGFKDNQWGHAFTWVR